MVKVTVLFGATGNVGKALLSKVVAAGDDDDDDEEDDVHKYLVFTRNTTSEPTKRFQKTTTTTGSGAGGQQQVGCIIEQQATTKCVIEYVKLPVKEDDTGYADPDALADILKACGGGDNMIDCAVLIVPQLIVHQAADWTKPIAEAIATANNVPCVVKVGTVKPETYEYGKCHLAAERILRETTMLPLTVIECGSFSTNPQWLGPGPPGAPYYLIDVFTGLSYLSKVPGLNMFRTMGGIAAMVGLDVTEPFTDLRDVADVLQIVLDDIDKHKGKTYSIWSDNSPTYNTIGEVYGKLLNRKIPVLDVQEDETRKLLELGGLKGEVIELVVECQARYREGVYAVDGEFSEDFATLTGGTQTPRTFEAFAKEQVDRVGKPWF